MDLFKDSVFNRKFDSDCDLINVKEYFEKYVNSIVPVDSCEDEKCKISKGCGSANCKNDAFYRNFLNISQEELNELKEKTCVDLLKHDDDVEHYYSDASDNEMKSKEKETNSPLVSVNRRFEMSNVAKSQFPRTFYKYCNYEWCKTSSKNLKSKLDFDILRFPTIVACVKVYHPFMSERSKVLKIKLLQEIHILGDQTLAQLKDKIVCYLDYIGGKDLSNECFLKEVGHNLTAKDEYPSSFIFIEDTFYNDTRTPDLIDLSKELREWATLKNLGSFQTAKMERARICNLNIKVGRPYVYQHQGNCEHIIMFSDIRLLDSSDPILYRSFPRIHSTGRVYGKHCMMCTDFYARWLVIGNQRLTHDKVYLCQKCFISYNYIDGKMIGSFQAYKYVDPVALL